MNFPIAFLLSSFVILLGYFPVYPIFDTFFIWQRVSNYLVVLIFYLVGFAPLFPLLCSIIVVFTRFRLPRIIGIGISLIVGIFGLTISWIQAGFSGAGAYMSLLYGVTLTMAVSYSVLAISQQNKRNGCSRYSWMFMTVPIIVSIWSLAAVPTILWYSDNISSGRPFCIAKNASSEKQIKTLADLRGLSFFTTESGFKMNSHWYFHGVLIVKSNSRNLVFNWSPRTFSFNRIDNPERYYGRPDLACKPIKNFWHTVSVI